MEKNIGILGSGFGLYGYLPAALSFSKNSVVSLKRYRKKFNSRPELEKFSTRIKWRSINSFFEEIDILITCLTPLKQSLIVSKGLKHPNIGHLILEKPLAENPIQSRKLLNTLIQSGRKFRIGYNFQYTKWGKVFLDYLKGKTPINANINWDFFAHHFLNNIDTWKRHNHVGGGVIRFYGIHIIALLGQSDSCKILSSVSYSNINDDIYKWQALFEINSIHKIQISINSADISNNFKVQINMANENLCFDLNNPFEEYEYKKSDQDSRVDVLTKILNSFDIGQQQYWNEIYTKINILWEEIETVTIKK